MKKTRKSSLRERAEECRISAQAECDAFNAEAEREAVEEFEAGETAKYFRENAKYVTGLVVTRLKAVLRGDLTFPLRLFDAETLARLLTADTKPDYGEKSYDENLSDEETVAAWERGDLVHENTVIFAETPATEMQADLGEAMLEYATAAASYAKHIGSSSLPEWAEMIDILGHYDMLFFHPLTSEAALRLIELEKSAANRLRLDKIIAELPSYKPAKKAKK